MAWPEISVNRPGFPGGLILPRNEVPGKAGAAQYAAPEIILYLMGALPNLAAAIAIPFVFLAIWADQKPAASYQAARRRFTALALVAGTGLIAWEFMQQSSRSLVFDHHDIGATIIGLFMAWLLFVVLTPLSNATKS